MNKAKDELGVTVTELDIKPFQENLKPMIEEIAGKSELSQKAYETIESMK